MNLHAKLAAREAQGRPLRVGLIGAGKFAAMYLAQVPRTPLREARSAGFMESFGWNDGIIPDRAKPI